MEKVICFDSLSALMVVVGGECGGARSDLVFRLERRGYSVGFLWIPVHVGVEGNKAADKAAKASLERDRVEVEVPVGRLECSIINERLIQ